MRSFTTIIMILITTVGLFSQESEPAFWVENPTYEVLSDQYSGKRVVYLKIANSYDFWYNESGSLRSYYSYYRKVRVNDDEAINEFNKIYIPISDDDQIVDVRARSINPQGEIVEFDTRNIKEIEEEEGDGTYKIFAIEGVEKGSEVEAYYCKQTSASNFGSIFYQFSYPLIEGEFKLTAPKNLFYKMKGYNGFPQPAFLAEGDKNSYTATIKDVPEVKEEEYSYSDPRRKRLEFKLDVNTNKGNYPLLTWDDAAVNIRQIIYSMDKKETKAIEKLASRFDLNGMSQLQGVKAIERYIKRNINIQEYSIPEFSNMEYVLKNNITNETGVTRLFANLFRAKGIEHVVGLTVSRDEKLFDPEFHSYNSLQTYVIYLPELDLYLEPGSTDSYVYCFPGLLTATWGLFMEEVQIRDYSGVIGTPRYIEPSPYNVNNHNSYIELKVSPEEGIAHVETEDCFKGLGGGILNEYYDLVADENKEAFLRQVLLVDIPDEDVTYIGKGPLDGKDAKNEPEFVISFQANTRSWVEIAGTNLLVKLGETIGPQVEMYQSEERESGVENVFNRWYYREIEFEIPEGYRIRNPEAAVFDIVYSDNGDKIYGFESDYSVEGNIYRVVIDEYYKRIFVEKENFEEFRKVVNAAADFNKVVLILEKISGE